MKATISLLILMASASSLVAQADVVAGPITNQANGHVYYLLGPADWHTSRNAARRLGGHLATVQDADENAWISSTFGVLDGSARNLWIGLTDEGHEGVWIWITGEPVLYTNWAAGEPNNHWDGTEHYGHMWPSPEFKWNDATTIGRGLESMPHGVVEVEPPANLGPLTIRVSEVELKWPSISNQVYQVQYRSDLTTNIWVDLFGTNIVGSGATIRFTEKVPEAEPRKFYRALPLTNSIPQ